MIRALKKIQTIYFCLVRINWIHFFRLYDRNANTILWYYPRFRKKFYMQSVERDFAFIAGFLKNNEPFRIYFGRNIGKFHHKTIFYSVTKYYELFGFDNYAEILHHISKQLEGQGNRVYPTSHETLFWENKAFMHEEFDRLKIQSPKTKIIRSLQALETLNDFQYPLLLKEPHSSSSMGLYKIQNPQELKAIIEKEQLFLRNETLLVQELLNIRKDIRITTVGDKICSHYWRINQQKEWSSTATGYGSKVDFEFLPESCIPWIEETARKLNLTTAGFDVTWQNDDLSNPPLVLEVSPFYQPNPPADIGNHGTYGAYKKKLLFKNSWDKRFVDIVFDLQISTVTYFLKGRV